MPSQPSLLPQQILPQDTAWGHVDSNGNVTINVNWWLFLYNIAAHVLNGSDGTITIVPSDFIPLAEIDAWTTDPIDLPKRVINAIALQPDLEPTPSLLSVATALTVASDDLLPDPPAQAQPVQAVTVGASPFTYTAATNGNLSIGGGTVTIVNLIRQGTSVVTGFAGSVAATIPLSRLDQIKITYSVAPTVNFFPT